MSHIDWAWFVVITTNAVGAILGAIMVWHYEYKGNPKK